MLEDVAFFITITGKVFLRRRCITPFAKGLEKAFHRTFGDPIGDGKRQGDQSDKDERRTSNNKLGPPAAEERPDPWRKFHRRQGRSANGTGKDKKTTKKPAAADRGGLGKFRER